MGSRSVFESEVAVTTQGAGAPQRMGLGNAAPLVLGGFFLVCAAALSGFATIPNDRYMAVLAGATWLGGGVLLYVARYPTNRRWLLMAFLFYTASAAMGVATAIVSPGWAVIGAIALLIGLILTRQSWVH